MEILIGTDPEVFIRNKETKEVVSAIGYIPGTKDEPHKISEEGHAVQTDNIMAEFCVPAASNPLKLSEDISICIKAINNMLPDNLETVIQASAKVSEDYLNNEQARLFGCDPDFNTYTLNQNLPPSADTNLRTAGGHIHIGYDNPEFEVNMKIVQAMDLFLGVPSIILDIDTERRKIYGKAGAFREKKYGVEYRVLSNFWIKTEESIIWAFEQAQRAVDFAINNDWLDDETQLKIQLAINDQNIDIVNELTEKFNLTTEFNKVLV